MTSTAPDTRHAIMNSVRPAALALLALVLPVGTALAEDTAIMKIRFDYGGQSVVATLDDNAASRSLMDMLPLTVTLEDYAATEKIADLPGPLDTEGAPDGMTPKAGDVTYYAPWGNLAIFIKDFRQSAGLVSLGRIVEGLDALKIPGTADVTIEAAPAE